MQNLQRIIWLASYPKSGNTWTRSFLANYFLPKGEAPDINSLRRFTTGDARQDIYDTVAGRPFMAADFDEWALMRPKVLDHIAASKPGHHFVKTHCKIDRIGPIDLIPPRVTAAAIYVLRNPFDVAPSLARHMSMSIDEAIEFMENPIAFSATDTNIFEVLGRWDDHVASWTGAQGLPLHVLRYEDLSDDTERGFRALLGFLRAPVRDGTLRRAIRASSFKELKKQERQKGFVERPAGMESFFAKGKAGAWREDLTPAQVARIRESFLPTIEKWYPELLDQTADVAREA